MNPESALWRAYRSKGDLRPSSLRMNGDCTLSGGFRTITQGDMEIAEREITEEQTISEAEIEAGAKSLLADEPTVDMTLESCPEEYRRYWLAKSKHVLEAARTVKYGG